MSPLSASTAFCAQVVFAGLWQGAALASVVAICLRLYPRTGAAVRSTVWSLTFVVALVSPLLRLPISQEPASRTSVATFHLSPALGYVIACLWAVFFFYRLVRLAVHLLHLRRVWRHAVPIAASEDTLAQFAACPQLVTLCTSADVDSPSVIGFRSSRLLIPAWLLAKLTPAELRQIVLHELEHVRRRDSWINLVQKFGLMLFPLNPALIWMDRRLSVERELACDAGVIARTAEPLEYASCLTRLAEYRLHYRQLALSLSAWRRRSELGRRVERLLRPADSISLGHARMATVLLGLCVLGFGVEMTRAPQLISFSNANLPAQTDTTVVVSPAARQAVIPVVYRPTSQPRETLLEAVMPATPHPTLATAPTTRSRPIEPRPHKTHPATAAKQPRLLETSMTRHAAKSNARPLSHSAVRAVYVVSEFPPSYAAVAFPDGWLIVQL